MAATTVTELLTRLGACRSSRRWAESYGTEFRRAWDECPEEIWMRWLLAELGLFYHGSPAHLAWFDEPVPETIDLDTDAGVKEYNRIHCNAMRRAVKYQQVKRLAFRQAALMAG
jgi:hypothetical protein